jgi:single-strand DNA-binding protein
MHFNFTIEGNVAAEPELRFTKGGTAVCQFRLAHTNRFRRDGEWVDGGTVWLTISCWRDLGERVAESIGKGDTVLVELNNDLRAEAFNGRGYLQASARSVALSMRFAPATSNRPSRSGNRQEIDEVAATGGYDTGAGAGYVDTATGEVGDQPTQDDDHASSLASTQVTRLAPKPARARRTSEPATVRA